PPPGPTLFPYPTLFRSADRPRAVDRLHTAGLDRTNVRSGANELVIHVGQKQGLVERAGTAARRNILRRGQCLIVRGRQQAAREYAAVGAHSGENLAVVLERAGTLQVGEVGESGVDPVERERELPVG